MTKKAWTPAELMEGMQDVEAIKDDINRLVDKLRPMMRGKHPEVQGGVLMVLAAMWLGGYHRSARDRIWRAHAEMVLDAAEDMHKKIWGKRSNVN
jgi:hypothetical protein